MNDDRFAEACVQAQDRVFSAARRLKAANEELDAAEKEHRLAVEALDRAEGHYYSQTVRHAEVQK